MDETRTGHRGPAVDQAALRAVLSRFATGITVITGHDDEQRRRAITVNTFASVSLDPPLILYCLGKSAFHFTAFANAKAFAVNILGADQQALSDRFARGAEDDFADLSVTGLATGSPVLAGCLAVLDCETEAVHDAGDHLIVVGRVRALDVAGGAEPLIRYASRYRRLTP